MENLELDVLQSIFDGSNEPINVKLSTLQSITENFSKERIIGEGGFATVYKGVLRNGEVAVKRIRNCHTIDEKLFHREVNSLLMVKHKNIVRFLGFCAHTEKKPHQPEGASEYILYEDRERILCFEYINNGSLENYIADELRGLQWDTRYLIIKGICEGLQYLHMEKLIMHMDLKPANILIDENMVAKITDFGLSRMVDNSQTKTKNLFFTPGYAAPEFIDSRTMSPSYDVYSLGVIIIQLVSGHRSIPDSNNVLRRWSHRWHKSEKKTPFRYQQIAKLIEIGLLCQEKDPTKRPVISDIISVLNELESTNRQINNTNESTVGQIIPYLEDDMLGIEPLMLRFPIELNTHISSSLEITNDTNAYFAFIIRTTSPLPYYIQPNKHTVAPWSKYSVNITLQPLDHAPQDCQYTGDFTVRSTKVHENLISEDITEDIFNREKGKLVDEVNLMITYKAEVPPVDVSLGSLLITNTRNLHGPPECNVSQTKEESKISQETATSTDLLAIHPKELRFPFEANKLITSPLHLKNLTDHCVAFILEPRKPKRYYDKWLGGYVPPKSTYTLIVTMRRQESLPDADEFKIRSSVLAEDHLKEILQTKDNNKYYNFLADVKYNDSSKVHKQKLAARCVDHEGETHNELSNQIVPMSEYPHIFSMDVHPTRPWIITCHYKSHFCIWNYETKEMVREVTTKLKNMKFLTAKFVEREQWIIAGGYDGRIHVYNDNETLNQIKTWKPHNEAITSLAIHSNETYILSSSNDCEIELYDWTETPTKVQTFEGHTSSVCQIAFNPMDASTFASVSEDKTIKIWNLGSSTIPREEITSAPIHTLIGHSLKVRCLHYFTQGEKQFLITGSDDKTAKIWDLQTNKCVETLEGHTDRVSAVCSHPRLPKLMTGSFDGTVRLWNSTTFRLENILNFCLEKVYAFGCSMENLRVMIGHRDGLVILEVDQDGHFVSAGSRQNAT